MIIEDVTSPPHTPSRAFSVCVVGRARRCNSKNMQTASRVVQTLERARAERQRSKEEGAEGYLMDAHALRSRSTPLPRRGWHTTDPATSARSTSMQQRPSPLQQQGLNAPASEPLRRPRSQLKPLATTSTRGPKSSAREPNGVDKQLDIVLRSKTSAASAEVISEAIRGPASARLWCDDRGHLIGIGGAYPPLKYDPFERIAKNPGLGAWRHKLAATEKVLEQSSNEPWKALSARAVLQGPSIVATATPRPLPPHASQPPGARLLGGTVEPSPPDELWLAAASTARDELQETSRSATPFTSRRPSDARHQTPPSTVLPLVPRPTENHVDAAASAKARAEEIAAERAALDAERAFAEEVMGQIAADRAAAAKARAEELAAQKQAALEAEKAAAEEVVARIAADRAAKEEEEKARIEAELAAKEERARVAAAKKPAKGEEERPVIHNLEGWESSDSMSPERPPSVSVPVPVSPSLRRRKEGSMQEPRSPSPPTRVMLAAAENVELVLTARPSVQKARGLETALEEAKNKAGPKPNETIKKLIDAAAEKLEETRDEIRRCAELRETRLRAFCTCAPLRDALREVFDVLSDADAGGLRRDDFFNLHLCLSREGFFGSEKAGTLLASYPYAYASPVWYRYFKSGFSGASGDKQGEFTEGSDNSEAFTTDLRIFSEGVKLWHILLAGGHVTKGLLSFEAIQAIAFEFADANLAHTHEAALQPFGGDVRTSLQPYLDFILDMKGSIVQVPSATDATPLFGARRRYVAGLGDDGSPLQRAAGGSPDGRRSSQQSAPTALASGGNWNVLATMMKTGGAAAFGAYVKHAWPNPGVHASEMNRRLSLLKLALSRDGPMSKSSVANEFREYCRIVGKGRSRQLSYHDVDRAWRRMQDKNYVDLTFRYEVAAREAISKGCREVLTEAQHADEEQTICFIKLIDLDCDGRISEDDFCQAMRSENLVGSIDKLRDKWQEAALALEQEAQP